MRTNQDKKHWERYLPAKPQLPRCLRLLLRVLTALERSALCIEKFTRILPKIAFSLARFILGILMLIFVLFMVF